MYRRVTSIATSAAVGLAAAVALLPAPAQAAPETYTGHLQVVEGDTIIGCAENNGSLAKPTTNPEAAYKVSISTGARQDMLIDGQPGRFLGFSDASASFDLSQTGGYTFLQAVAAVPAGSPSVNSEQSAVWSIDPATQNLSVTYVWPDSTPRNLTTMWFSAEGLIAATPDLAATEALFDYADPVTFRIGEACSGPVTPPDVEQTITFTSTAPETVHPGDTYDVTATGGESGNPVTFSSSTRDECTIEGSTVTFHRAGTCTIVADQAAATGFLAADPVEQDVEVDAFATSLDLSFEPANPVTGQGTTATAQLSTEGSLGDAGGVVQFRVDGDIVDHVAYDEAGRASTALDLGVGTHQVDATWWPEANYQYGYSTDTDTVTVSAAGTTTKVAVKPRELSATVAPIAPGAGTPTGEVTFFVDGKKVGTAALDDGTAKLAHTVPTDGTHAVSAAYAGSTDFTASSGSTSRSNPAITARVISSQKSRGGWYRSPVTISFGCDAKGAELTTACPKPVKVSRQGASTVTRTIHTADGGIATVTASVKIDRSKPRVGIRGVKSGRSYFDAPKPTCSAKDSLSGVKTCKVTTKRSGSRVVVTAKATDVAGNVRTKRVAYRLAGYKIEGAKLKNGVYQVRHGETYTIVVRGSKARYVYATPAPGKPHRGSVPFKKAGQDRWALGVKMSMTTSRTRSWNLGHTQNGKLHVIKVKVVG
ncbi:MULTISPECIES: Ig-like domain-containing protein [unclassified Aeromicrobium]|uniref:Ig-like domain-containing protein n=1 Tax=unclassified Aeromicrobium TaxID=2633570 RepID=UPI00396AFBE7